MSATAFNVAMAWLQVAHSALERAAEYEVAIELEARARYEAARKEVEQMIRDAEYELRVGEVVRAGLALERRVA